MKGKKSAKKPKYEKPILIPFNHEHALGVCNAGSANITGFCKSGAQASSHHCMSGSVPGKKCMTGATR